jgi:MerR family transcriptional regulator, light-induced transcriptional regulator
MSDADLGPRSRHVYEALRASIVRGDLAPGSQLPAHLRLAADFGVAPMTVRQVLARLEAEGLVSRQLGRGTFVRQHARSLLAPADAPGPGLDDLRASYVASLQAGERDRAVGLLLGAAAVGIALVDLCVEVIQPAQYAIGELWQTNRVTVAGEHLATAISEAGLAHLVARAARAPRNGRRVLVACVEGDLHDLGARMVADLLDLDGFDVRFLGASVPTDALAAMVRSVATDLLVLSATLSSDADCLRQALPRLRAAATPGRLVIAVGGQAFAWAPTLAEDIAADICTADARAAVAAARRALGLDAALAQGELSKR